MAQPKVTHERGRLRFAVDSALLLELGEQLVSRKSVALAELVKNAYDADATKVRVAFDTVSLQPGGTITVEDNGQGMTFAEVRDGWMRIATTTKRDEAKSKRFHRTLTGAKGVGRFAARKLAKRLTLDTRSALSGGKLEHTVVEFDWGTFMPGTDLARKSSRFQRSVETGTQPGTKLILADAHDRWSASDINDTRDDLRSLTPPFASAAIKLDRPAAHASFDVTIEAPEFPSVEGSVTQSFLSAAASRLRATAQSDGSAVYELRSRGVAGTRRFVADLGLTKVASASLEIHFFKYDKDSLTGTGVSVVTARDLGASAGGVKIYLDDFRVFPYGDPGDDWLDLDADRGARRTSADRVLRDVAGYSARSLLNLPGNNNLFGAVFISRIAHPDLRPTINREGLPAGTALDELQRFVRVGIDWMVIERARLDQRQKKPRPKGPVSSVGATVSASVNALKQDLKTYGVSDDSALGSRLDELRDAALDAEKAQSEKVRVLRILASTGTMLLVFTHQIRATLDGLRGAIRSVRSGGAPADHAVERLETWVEQLEAQGSELGLLLGRRSRTESRELALSPVVEQVIGTFKGYADDRNVALENDVPKGLRTPPIREAELHSILINLLTNSLKAVSASGIRRIKFEAHRRGGALVISVLDTGGGVARKNRSRVFEPFETTSAPDPILGVGTGLGLTIVRDIVEEHSGTVGFVEPMPGWGAHVEVRLPDAIPT